MADGKMIRCRQKRWENVVQSRWLRNGAGGGGTKCLSVVHMSDTHGNFYDVPDGDILIHSGDFTNEGIRHGMEDVNDFMSYFKALPHKYKVLVPGNHELGLDRLPVDDLRRMLGCTPGRERSRNIQNAGCPLGFLVVQL